MTPTELNKLTDREFIIYAYFIHKKHKETREIDFKKVKDIAYMVNWKPEQPVRHEQIMKLIRP